MTEHYDDVAKALRDFFGRPDPVGFAQARVQPPATGYVTRDDRLLVRVFNNAAGVRIAFNARILQPDPVQGVRFWRRDLTPTSDTVLSEQPFELGEGFLLSLTAVAGAGSPDRGQCFVQAVLAKAAASFTQFPALLLSDYLVRDIALGWPGGLLRSPLDGSGVVRSFTGTNPAAGAEISETVPNNQRWRLHSLTAQLVSSLAAVTRQVALVLDDGADIYQRSVSNNTQVSGETRDYTFHELGSADKFNATFIEVPTGPFPQMPAGHRIRTITASLQAGDNWGAPEVMIEEWIEPS